MIFIQRVGTSGSLSYDGDAARIFKDGVLVQDWTTGGTITDIPQGNGYELQVRTGTDVTNTAFAVGVVVFTLGQSNMHNWFATPYAAAHPSTGAYSFVNGKLTVASGSGALAFAGALGRDLGDVPVAFVDGSVGGSALLQKNDGAYGYWMQEGPGSLYQNAVDQLAAAGGRAELTLWTQGEQDASFGRTTSDQYATALDDLLTRVQQVTGSSETIVGGLGPSTDQLAPSYVQIRAGQIATAATLPDTAYVPTALDLDTVDTLHLEGASREWQAIEVERVAAAALGGTDMGVADRYGTEADDVLQGADDGSRIAGQGGDDVLAGGSGHDLLRGGAGQDLVSGNDGDDMLSGGSGDDTVRGGVGTDEIYGDDGDDLVYGNDGTDLIYGGDGADTLYGGAGRDTMFGGNGRDLVDGGADNDHIEGGAGDDILKGGAGDDLLVGGPGADVLSGGDGSDRFIFRPGDLESGVYDGIMDFTSGQDSIDLRGFSSSLIVSTASFDPNVLLIDPTGAGHPDQGIRVYATSGPVVASDIMLPPDAVLHLG